MKYHVLRGGSFYLDSRFLRTTYRSGCVTGLRSWYFGFRIVVVRRKP
jgi:formylglycine-generating enzyme required for sulfatase activity